MILKVVQIESIILLAQLFAYSLLYELRANIERTKVFPWSSFFPGTDDWPCDNGGSVLGDLEGDGPTRTHSSNADLYRLILYFKI